MERHFGEIFCKYIERGFFMFIRDILYKPNSVLMESKFEPFYNEEMMLSIPPLKTPIDQYIGYLHIPLDAKLTDKKVYTFGLTEKTPNLKIIILKPIDENQHPNVVRIRIDSNVDDPIQLLDIKNNSVSDKESFKHIKMVKQLPGFFNNKSLFPEKFEQKYNRVKLNVENGLVGYIYLKDVSLIYPVKSNPEVEAKKSKYKAPSSYPSGYKSSDNDKEAKHDSEAFIPDREPPDRDSKRKQAVAIYKANRSVKRKHVVNMIAKRLQMTHNGASSYYTYAKNHVEGKE